MDQRLTLETSMSLSRISAQVAGQPIQSESVICMYSAVAKQCSSAVSQSAQSPDDVAVKTRCKLNNVYLGGSRDPVWWKVDCKTATVRIPADRKINRYN